MTLHMVSFIINYYNKRKLYNLYKKLNLGANKFFRVLDK
jgi:hypothetical protein